MEEFLQVGVITSTHGLKGEMKVFPTTDDPNRFKRLNEVYLDNGKEKRLVHPEGVKFFKQFVILKLKEYNSIEEIETLKGKELFVSRAMAIPLKKNEYFIADLIGLVVKDEDGNVIGTLTDVMETGANDVYVIENEEKKEFLIPAIKDCIKNVDLNAQTITIHVMQGLLD